MRKPLDVLVAVLALLSYPACATINHIPGTTVADSKINREIIEACERYRRALEDRDGATLLAMALPNYYEDSGTPKGDDDYGYEGLKQVVSSRLAQVRSIRYNVEYRNIELKGRHAKIDIRYDASFQIATDMGDRWERKQNDKRLEMEFDGRRWMFLSGM